MREKSKEQLELQLQDLKKELNQLRVQQVAASNQQKVSQIGTLRKSIARVLTVITQKQREALKQVYAGSKYKPLDLRSKLTRAMRRRLTPFEKSRKTLRQRKHDMHFAPKKYAVTA